MERLDIQQQLHNTLGVMLIDKAQIREDATLKDLALEAPEIEGLLDQLEFEFGIVFPTRIRDRIHKAPEHLTLQILVDVILVLTEND
ncbi:MULTISPECIES: hypothetical protein [unclassified Pseudomonas]|uniref:hypothetical protein n=1 Tax=unclassified Pseudomonas TaxID=196821 RepID=UPI002AC933CB|nr:MULTISPECIES: hypothetical protein [unclassified Pseudomonas]MEB0042848.1 hypothetical protein [Pseudomonas sp. MH10]MEB0075899.1 hypothetical protein [Pseudomonas sp. MH10out]MEB0091535.1 hypothetical protein [Pseudomonas sp. CCI4.2]MEB0104072.1 hypothetical protein [Pseudomonas sp. CCI3.2]MEB0120445.1 hypothetical protein [Pseudomonas sp. CCI1.2]